MENILEFELGGHTEVLTLGKVARQASGSVLYRLGDTVILAAVVFEKEKVVDEDFLPMTVQYIEKSYAAGKFPGGFVKREAKPGDFETLTSRIIDRSLRPLFPKNYRHPTQITVQVLSCDENVDLQRAALNAASAALMVSDLPIEKPVYGVRIGRKEGRFIVNPSNQELQEGELDLFISGVHDDLLMIEMRSMATKNDIPIAPSAEGVVDASMYGESYCPQNRNEINEDDLLEALRLAQKEIQEASATYQAGLKPFAKEKMMWQESADPVADDVLTHVDSQYGEAVKQALLRMAKSERATELDTLACEILETETVQSKGWNLQQIAEAIQKIKRKTLRNMAVKESLRADGRKPDQIRPISIETNLLPSTHSSALFTRGETQALVIATLGGDMDAQVYDLLHEKGSSKERFMVHYNFPGFCVGEASMIGPPGRRELGHGNLAKRALEPVLADDGHTIRLVSEILESNGSSSMATVCGGSLALKAANVNVIDLVAGVAMGLVVEGDEFAVLTDIMGLEDHDGDMDFKVAGTRAGITALQMDIKLSGLSHEIIKAALYQAKTARESILGTMEEAAEKIEINEKVLPSSNVFFVSPGKIVDIIGQAGKTIKEIIDRFDVAIDLDRKSGEVKVSGSDRISVNDASDHIKNITSRSDSGGGDFSELYKEGDILKGKVKKIVEFGAFIELPKGNDGLLHISKITKGHTEKVSDVLSEGQELEVEVLSVSKKRIELGRVADS